MRKFMGAKDGYYGNCVANHLLAVATRGTVAEAGIVDLTKMIKRAKDQLPHKVKMGNKSGNDDDLMRGLCGRYDMMHVSSWKNIGFEQVDFGSGAPARVIFHVREGTPPVPTCIIPTRLTLPISSRTPAPQRRLPDLHLTYEVKIDNWKPSS
nr:unnamed protein product [Digitaria exilis]